MPARKRKRQYFQPDDVASTLRRIKRDNSQSNHTTTTNTTILRHNSSSENDDDISTPSDPPPFQPTDPNAHHYTTRASLPWDLQPSWKHRLSLFSLYDDPRGIYTTDPSWYEVTPEPIALRIATHISTCKPDTRPIILDAFAGIGGNAIAFARSGKFRRVYAIERDPAALECARHNADVYGVGGNITWFEGDCFALLGIAVDKEGRYDANRSFGGSEYGNSREGNDSGGGNQEKCVEVLREVVSKAGVIFASPPWGGPGYDKQSGQVMDLSEHGLMPYGIELLVNGFRSVCSELVLYLPRTGDLNQIADLVGDENRDGDGIEMVKEVNREKTQVVHYCLHENSKAMCVYLGSWKRIMEG